MRLFVQAAYATATGPPSQLQVCDQEHKSEAGSLEGYRKPAILGFVTVGLIHFLPSAHSDALGVKQVVLGCMLRGTLNSSVRTVRFNGQEGEYADYKTVMGFVPQAGCSLMRHGSLV